MSISVLDFEKPIAEIADKIDALRVAAVENPDLLPQINKLKIEESALRKKIYSKLSTWQKVQVARHPNRPHTLDFIERIFDEFEELHGDRQFADDGSLVGGLANLEGIPVVVIGNCLWYALVQWNIASIGLLLLATFIIASPLPPASIITLPISVFT